MIKGEVWLVEFPFADGHEQIGTRPVIIIADTKVNICIVVPLTSNLQALRFPYTIEINPSRKNGLREISVALTFQVRAIDKKRLIKKLGKIEMNVLKEIDLMLKNLLDI